jgi:hypothetical protein
LLWIWHSRYSGNAIDHRLSGREARRDPVVAGLA